LSDAALAVLEEVEERLLASEERQDFFYLEAWALLEAGDIESSRENLVKALALGEDAVLRSMEAQVHLASGDYDKARTASERAIQLDDRNAFARHVQGVVLTFLGRMEDADRAFARAVELEPETYIKPHRLSRKEFDKAVEEVLNNLPAEFGSHLENVEVAVEDVPAPDLVVGELSHDLLGLYQGLTVLAEEWRFPDRILLFQRNIENVSSDRRTLLRVIRDTLLHEVAHHFGLGESRIRAVEDSLDEN